MLCMMQSVLQADVKAGLAISYTLCLKSLQLGQTEISSLHVVL